MEPTEYVEPLKPNESKNVERNVVSSEQKVQEYLKIISLKMRNGRYYACRTGLMAQSRCL